MDTSNWTHACPNIQIYHNNKLFYKKYLYKLSFYDAFFYLMRSCPVDPDHQKKIDLWKTLLHKHKEHSKFRTEYRNLNIYTNDLDTWFGVLNTDIAEYKHCLIGLTIPKNQTISDIIIKGQCVSKLANSYQYKVYTRSRVYKNLSQKHHVGNYLRNLRENLRITDNFLITFLNDVKYVFQGYFYCNDLKILDLIFLIDHKLINRTESLVSS